MVAFSLQNPVEGLNTVPQLPLIVISCVLVVRGIGSVACSLKQLTARFSETFCVTALLPDSTFDILQGIRHIAYDIVGKGHFIP